MLKRNGNDIFFYVIRRHFGTHMIFSDYTGGRLQKSNIMQLIL